jgi:hypothetical protein
MDNLFNIKWVTYLKPAGSQWYYTSKLIELKDSTFIVLVNDINPNNNQFHLYKISKTGQILNQKVIIGSACSAIHLNAMKLLSDSSLIVTGACVDGQNAYIARVSGVGLPMVPNFEPYNQNLEVEVFPNPFSQSTTFKINGPPDKTYTLSIISSLGQTIQIHEIKNQSFFTLNRTGLATGLYLYVLSDEEGKSVTGKLVVE